MLAAMQTRRNNRWIFEPAAVLAHAGAAMFAIFFVCLSFLPQPLLARYELVIATCALAVAILLCSAGVHMRLFSPADLAAWFFVLCMFPLQNRVAEPLLAQNRFIHMAVIFIGFFFLGKALFSLERTEIYTAAIIASCSGLVALYGLAETVLAFNPLYAFWVDNPFYQRYIEFPVRPMSTQFNPAVLATYLACSLPFSWALSRSQSNLAKWIGRISLIVGVACLILTFSRGSILAAFVAWLFIIFLLGKKQQVKLILSSAVIVSSLATFCHIHLCA